MRIRRWILWTVAGSVLAAGSWAYADSKVKGSKLKGWVTKVDPGAQTIQIDGQTIPTSGVPVTGGFLEPGVFVSVKKGQIKVKPQHRPLDDQVSQYPVKGTDNPGRSEFSHLRHFNALGEKQCKTCHGPEMGLVTSPSYASRSADPKLEPHGPKSTGRYCSTCHDGATRLSQVGVLGGRADRAIFTSLRTKDSRSCQGCHAPADHRRDFTPPHGDVAEKSGGKPCLPCHAQDRTVRDRRLQTDLLAAETILKASPDDPQAALVVGPNNFCVYCHRRDDEWQR